MESTRIDGSILGGSRRAARRAPGIVVGALLRLVLLGVGCVAGYLLLVLFSPAARAEPGTSALGDVVKPVREAGTKPGGVHVTRSAGETKHRVTRDPARTADRKNGPDGDARKASGDGAKRHVVTDDTLPGRRERVTTRTADRPTAKPDVTRRPAESARRAAHTAPKAIGKGVTRPPGETAPGRAAEAPTIVGHPPPTAQPRLRSGRQAARTPPGLTGRVVDLAQPATRELFQFTGPVVETTQPASPALRRATAVLSAGTAPLIEAGTVPLIEAGTVPLIEAGTAPLIEAGTAPLIDVAQPAVQSLQPVAHAALSPITGRLPGLTQPILQSLQPVLDTVTPVTDDVAEAVGPVGRIIEAGSLPGVAQPGADALPLAPDVPASPGTFAPQGASPRIGPSMNAGGTVGRLPTAGTSMPSDLVVAAHLSPAEAVASRGAGAPVPGNLPAPVNDQTPAAPGARSGGSDSPPPVAVAGSALDRPTMAQLVLPPADRNGATRLLDVSPLPG